jgi:hypothetical protein
VADNVLKFTPPVIALTCSCGGQTFILVLTHERKPDFVYCTECQLRLKGVDWTWDLSL